MAIMKVFKSKLAYDAALPFFLFLMTAIASILTMNTLKKSDNLKYIVLGLVICV